MGTKRCTKCGIEKPHDEFSKSTSRKDGLQTACKECFAAYFAKNKEKIAAYRAEYYAKNKDKSAARSAEYYAKNKDKIAARRAAYRARKKREKHAASSDEE